MKVKNKRRKPIKFPISLDIVEKIIQENHIDYKIDYSQHVVNDMINDRTQSIFLYCNKHKDFKIKTSWKKINSRDGRQVEYCNYCKCDKEIGNYYLRYKVEEIFKNHPIHPKQLIDDRFDINDRILTKMKLKTKCIFCNYQDYITIERFNSKDHRCKGCKKLQIKNGEFNFHTLDKINNLFLPLGFKISSVDNLLDEKKILSYECNKCKFSQVVPRDYILRNKLYIEKNQTILNFCKKCNELSKYNDIKEYALTKNFILVDKFEDLFDNIGLKESINNKKKFNFICKNNSKHKRHCRIACLHNDGICKECIEDKRGFENFKKLKKIIQEDFGGLILEKEKSIKYNEEISCRCLHSHKFMTSLQKIGKKNFCPECSDKIGEKMTRLILTHIFKPYEFIKTKPSFLKINNSYLEYDAYCEDLKIAAEYNGLQHYVYRKHYHKTYENFLRQQKNDNIKLKLSKENNIKVLIIKEEKNIGPNKINIIKQIMQQCEELEIKLPNFDEEINIQNAYLGNETKYDTLKLIEEYNGHILKQKNNEYKSKRAKILLKCADPDHKSFKLDPRQLIEKNKWCPECETSQNMFEKFCEVFDGIDDDIFYLGYENKNNTYSTEKIYFKLKCSSGHEIIEPIRNIERMLNLNKHWCKYCRRIDQDEKNKKNKWDIAISKIKKDYQNASIDFELSNYDIGKIVFYTHLGIKNEFSLGNSKYLSDKPKEKKNNNSETTLYISEEKKLAYMELIKSIYGEDASYVSNVGKDIREWHCGKKGHPIFKQTATRLKQEKERRGCKICCPSNSTKVTIEILMYVANEINKFYFPNESIKLLSENVNNENIKSQQNYFFSCPNKYHLPFSVSFDNMSRKNYGCPECQNRVVKNIKIKMQECLKIANLDLNIKELILIHFPDLNIHK